MISQSDFQALLDRTAARITNIEATSNTLFERSNLALHLLPADLTGDLHDTLISLRDILADLFAQLGKIIVNPGWPPGLLHAAGQWTTAVGGPASAMSPRLGTDQLRIDTFWQGSAATAYTATLPAQRKALEAMKQATDILETALTKIATGVVAMWVGIAFTLTAFLIELATESAAAATVVGAPPAAAAAGLSTGKAAALVTAICSAFATYLYLVTDSMATLRETLWADSAFPNSRWPRSTTADFSDGSLTDGDTTDWRLNTHD